jgi:hypothetical protein
VCRPCASQVSCISRSAPETCIANGNTARFRIYHPAGAVAGARATVGELPAAGVGTRASRANSIQCRIGAGAG